MRQSGVFHRDVLNGLRLWRVWGYLAINDLRGKFARSSLGAAWIVVSFAIWAGGVGLIYARLFQLDTRTFVPFLTVGFALWGYITASFVESSGSFLGSAGYVKQFNLPKQVYIYRTLLAQTITLSFSLLVCVVVIAVFGHFSIAGLALALPGLILLVAAATFHAFLSAYITPYIRDFPHAMSSLMNVIFFVTPIIFPAKMLEERGLGAVYQFNPFYYLLEVVRHPLLTGSPPTLEIWGGVLGYVMVLALVVMPFCKRLDSRLVYAL
ncbi:MAG TPA: ABC transporter permease [Pseudoxanthomonas sp.]